MGEYWFPVNVTRREYIHAHRLDCGLKLGEWTSVGSRVMALAAKWAAGDTVVLMSDYDGVIRIQGSAEAPSYDDMRDEYTEIVEASGTPSVDALRRLADALLPEMRMRYPDFVDVWQAGWQAELSK